MVSARKDSFEQGEIRQAWAASGSDAERVYLPCPYCISVKGSEDASRKLRLDTRTGEYKCFRCETTGRLAIEGAVEYRPEVIETPPAEVESPSHAFSLQLYGQNELATPLLEPAVRYLEKRGVEMQAACEIGLAYCTSGYHQGRIVVPVWSRRRLVGWSARDITGQAERKYLYPRGMERDKIMFNLDAITHKSTRPLLCVEGVFDALPYWPYTCAFLGKPTKGHLKILSQARRPLVICLDGDAWLEGWGTATQLALQSQVPIGCIRLPAGKDPNTVDRALLRRAAWDSLKAWPQVLQFNERAPEAQMQESL